MRINSCHVYEPIKSQQHFTNVLHYWYVTPFERFIHLHVTSRKDVSTDVRTTVNAAVNEFHWILTTHRQGTTSKGVLIVYRSVIQQVHWLVMQPCGWSVR